MAVMREVWWSDGCDQNRYGGAMAVIREVWWSDGCDERGMVERDTQTVSVIKAERYGGARNTYCVCDQDREVWWSETHRLCL